MQKLLNVQQAADLLDLKVKTIYTYVCKKKIPYVKLGARVLFQPEKLEMWVNQCAIDSIKNSVSKDKI